jgi:hypothetical protein
MPGPTSACLWPPNHTLVAIGIIGVSDPNTNATITIDQVTQDEPTNGLGDGDTAVDAIIKADGTVLLRAERSGGGDGRVYHVHFTASDPEGSASGVGPCACQKTGRASPSTAARSTTRDTDVAKSALHTEGLNAPSHTVTQGRDSKESRPFFLTERLGGRRRRICVPARSRGCSLCAQEGRVCISTDKKRRSDHVRPHNAIALHRSTGWRN